jgi:1,4-dihydroxy-2-naphthoate octaprenyltransferase
MGVIFAHLSVNVFNDYFDNLDGTDEKNSEYFQQLSGGSRAIELGLISLSKTKTLAHVLCLIAIIFGVLTLLSSNSSNYFEIFLIAKAALSLGYFYTAPPFRLVSRKGLGELTIFLTFGPLLTLGVAFAIFKGDLMSSEHFINCLLLGIPMGLLTTNILLINQFPDAASDKITGKNHLVVTFGKKKSRWIYLFILILTVLVSIYLALNVNYLIFVATAITSLFGLSITKHLFKYYKSRELVKSNWNTILLQAVFCIILIISFLLK